MGELLQTLKLSWYVVIRHWSVFRKEFLANISPMLADPALTLGTLGIGLSPFLGRIHGVSYAAYLGSGIAGTITLYTAFFECSYNFYLRMTSECVFRAMLTTSVGVTEIVLGQYIWVMARSALMATGAAVVLELLGLLGNPWAILFFPFIAGLLSVPCATIGLLSACYVKNINQFQTIYSFVISPMYFLSGVFFPLETKPGIEAIMQISPFYHGVRLFQIVSWDKAGSCKIYYHVIVLVLFALVTSAWLGPRIRRRLVS